MYSSLLRGHRPLSPPIFPALFSAPPSLRGIRSSPRRELPLWRVHIRKGVRQKKGGKPARTAVVSPPRPIRLRSRPLFTAERPAAWPVEDGVRSVMSGGDGGVVWWSSVVEWWLSKITKGKEKRYLKITARIITYIPSIQQVGTNYTWTYRDI